MLEITTNELLEDDDDDFFAEAIRSISELESTSSNIDKQKPFHEAKKHNLLNYDACAITNLLSENKIEKNDSSKTCNLPETKLTSNTENAIQSVIDSVSLENGKNSSLDRRFNPGFTLKAKKRKYPGPVGALIDEYSDEILNNNEVSPKKLSLEETEVQIITSSQFSVEELMQSPSWQKLQEDVSSSCNLLSTAKHFSIQQVLSDTAKKKLPKHIIVPVLCIYVKKLNLEESVSIFMDDTGEINGKISKDILSSYCDFLKTGISLIVKKVPFVCNVMLLEKSNLVSLYLEDGSVQHIQNLGTALEEEESSKPLACICPVTPKAEKSFSSFNRSDRPQSVQSTNTAHAQHTADSLFHALKHQNESPSGCAAISSKSDLDTEPMG